MQARAGTITDRGRPTPCRQPSWSRPSKVGKISSRRTERRSSGNAKTVNLWTGCSRSPSSVRGHAVHLGALYSFDSGRTRSRLSVFDFQSCFRSDSTWQVVCRRVAKLTPRPAICQERHFEIGIIPSWRTEARSRSESGVAESGICCSRNWQTRSIPWRFSRSRRWIYGAFDRGTVSVKETFSSTTPARIRYSVVAASSISVCDFSAPDSFQVCVTCSGVASNWSS